MDTPTTETAGLGHNQPDHFEALKEQVNEMMKLGDAWFVVESIDDEERAARAKDLKDRINTLLKDVDEKRLATTKSLREETDAINKKFNGLKPALEKIKGKVGELLTAFLKEQDRKAEEERKRQEDEALSAMQEAEEARRKDEEAAQSGEGAFSASMEAEAAQQAADEAFDKAAEMAKQRASTKGHYSARSTTLRTYYSAEITDFDLALGHFRDHPKVRDVIQQLANQWAISPEKRKTPIPGVKLKEEQRAA